MTTDPLQPLIDALRLALPQVDGTSLTTAADQLVRGQPATVGDSIASLTFGQGNDFRDATITIGSVVGRDNITLNITFPQPLNPQAAILQHLLYHHESATIFANRLDTFVGREAEIAEIRQHIIQVMPTGGYVTITAQAGEGKSSVIARMVSQDGPDQTAFHFIALTPGREYQLSLLRPIVARLILKHSLPTTYFPGESYPAMRDYFHSVLRQLSERGVQEVIYIDGLDQLEAEPGGTRDLSFLPTSPPSGMVLVLGTRPDDTLQPLEGKKVQVECRLPHLSYPDFQALLMRRGVVTPAAYQLYTALQGNAFYLALVVQELKAGPIADLDAFVERISDNPDNLFGLTIERLQRDYDQWERVLEPLLSLLLVAQAPLDRAMIRGLIEVNDMRLRRGLGQFGGLVAQDANGQYFIYHLKVRDYLAENTEQPDQPFVVSQEQIVSWHTTLARWCVRDAQDIERIWVDTTGLEQIRRWYARHHYVTHLVLGREWEQLQQVINTGMYGRYKRYFDPSTYLYAQDLDRARAEAVQRRDLAHLWRWSLLRVSFANQMNSWPDALFVALVHLGRTAESISRIELVSGCERRIRLLSEIAPLLTIKEAFLVWQRAQVMAETISDTYSKATAVMTIVNSMIKSGNLIEARVLADTITNERKRLDGLCNVVIAQIKANDFVGALDSIAIMSDVDAQLWGLFQLTLVLSKTPSASAKIIYTKIGDIAADLPDSLASVVTACALATAGHFEEARVAVAAISESIWQRTAAFHTLISALTTAGRFTEAQAVAASIPNAYLRVEELLALAQTLSQSQHPDADNVFAVARTAINSVTDPEDRTKLLCVFTNILAETGRFIEARTFANAIPAPHRRIESLLALALTMSRVQHPDVEEAFAAARTVIDSITDRKGRTDTLSALANTLAETNRFTEAYIIADAVPDAARDDYSLPRIKVLWSLVNKLAQVGHFATARSIATTLILERSRMGTFDRIEALCSLMNTLAQSDGLIEARKIIDSMPVDGERAKIFSSLACSLAGCQHPNALATFEEACTFIKVIQSTPSRAPALQALVVTQAANGAFGEARATANSIPHTYDHAIALYALVRAMITLGCYAEAYDTADAILDMEERTDAFCTIAKALVEINQCDEASSCFAAARIAATKIPETEWRENALRSLATSMIYASCFREARVTIDTIPSVHRRAEMLLLLVLTLAQTQHPDIAEITIEARTTIDAITDPRRQADMLCDLAMVLTQIHHPDATKVFARARVVADTLPPDWQQAQALGYLSNVLGRVGRFVEARAAADAILLDWHKIRALWNLSAALSTAGCFEDARATADIIPDNIEQAKALQNLSADLITARRFAEARVTAEAIPSPQQRVKVLCQLATALMQSQDIHTTSVFAAARTVIDCSTTPSEQVMIILTIALTMAQNQHREATEMFEIAKNRVDSIPHGYEQMEALCNLAQALIDASYFEDARSTIDAIPTNPVTDDRERSEVLYTLSAGLATAGRFDEARAAAHAIGSNRYRLQALQTLTTALIRNSRFEEARVTIDEIPWREERRDAFMDLHTALMVCQQWTIVATNVLQLWKVATSRDELLCWFHCVLPLLSHAPELGYSLRESFTWVDKQLYDQVIPSDIQRMEISGRKSRSWVR
jgi:tetratricopeptide (TPR) repeat protein